MNKQALRKQFGEKRLTLLPTVREEKSLLITRKLLELQEFKDAKSVLFYVSTPEEVATHDAIEQSLALGKTVFAPKVDGLNLLLCPLNSLDELSPSEIGILEPRETQNLAHPQSIDLIVIPGLAFDLKGNRLGHGKGFYDRLLKETKGFKVALAFDEQVTEELPTESHDVPVDLVLTDTHTYTF